MTKSCLRSQAVRDSVPGKMHRLAGAAGAFSDKIAEVPKTYAGVTVGGTCGWGTPYDTCWKKVKFP